MNSLTEGVGSGTVVPAIPLVLVGTGSRHHDEQRTPTPSASSRPEAKKSGKPKKKNKKNTTTNDEKDAVPSRRHVALAAGPPTGPRFATVTRLLLKNVMTGLCADLPGSGHGHLRTPLQQFTCTGSSHDNEQWDLVVNDKGGGPRGADLFTIRNSKDDHCADLPGNGAVDHGTHVIEWSCSSGHKDNQMWYLVKRSKNGFWIRNQTSHKDCLDVLGTDDAGGRAAALTVWPCSSQDDHLWSFH